MSKLWQSEFPVYFTPPPTRADKRLYKDAPDPPQPDPRMFEIMDKQVGLSQEALQFVKQSYAENQVRQQALDRMNLQMGDSLVKDAETNRKRGQEAYDFYKDKGRPLQEKVLQDAQNYDNQGNIAAFQGRAAADVNNAFGQVEAQQSRSLARYGVMPNANRLATINSNMAMAKAAAQAGAMTNAEMGVRDRALNMRAGASNMVAGMPNTAMQWGQAGQSAGQAAMGNGMAVNGANMQNQGMMMSGFGTAGGFLGGAANTGSNLFNAQMQGYQAQQAAGASSSAGFGSLVGQLGSAAMMSKSFADGGVIRGPGTGVSDSIPAVNASNGQPLRVSNGEYVVPADVVRAKGEEFFQKLIEKHHKPAALQRRRG